MHGTNSKRQQECRGEEQDGERQEPCNHDRGGCLIGKTFAAQQILFDMGSLVGLPVMGVLRNSCKNNQGDKQLIFYDLNQGKLEKT